MHILPVIMSGGSGTRLWPVSTDERPKQFHALGSKATMLQDTIDRVHAPEFLDPLIISSVRHGAHANDQLSAMGASGAVLLEPFGRNTAAVAVMAAQWAKRTVPGALVLLLPADSVIADADGFRRAVVQAAAIAQTRIVTFGISPTGPETGYGYIEAGEPIADGVFHLQRFVEKPEKALAEQYLAQGGYSWNAGIFLFEPDLLLSEAERLCPEVVKSTTAALDGAKSNSDGLLLEPAAFAACPSLPIDIAVMEKTDKAAVMPISVGWADLGSWSELWRLGEQDQSRNHARGDTVAFDSTGSLLWTDGPSISVIGVRDLIVVASQGHIIVLPKDRAQDVKRIVEYRKSRDSS